MLQRFTKMPDGSIVEVMEDRQLFLDFLPGTCHERDGVLRCVREKSEHVNVGSNDLPQRTPRSYLSPLKCNNDQCTGALR